MTEARYDPVTCVREATFRYVDAQGRLNVAQEPERIRVYALPELNRMFSAAGLEWEAVYGQMTLPLTPYDADCRKRRLVVGRKT